jgi:hypothetical protein
MRSRSIGGQSRVRVRHMMLLTSAYTTTVNHGYHDFAKAVAACLQIHENECQGRNAVSFSSVLSD